MIIPIELLDEILIYVPVQVAISLRREFPKRYILARTERDSPANDIHHMRWLHHYGVGGSWPLETYPETDLRGMLWLEKHYPIVLDAEILAWVAAESAVYANDLSLITYLNGRLCQYGYAREVMEYAAAMGRLEIVQWMCEHYIRNVKNEQHMNRLEEVK